MPTAQKLTLAVLINAVLISSAYASEQSEAKGFVEDASGSVLLRTGFIDRDKKNGVPDTRSTAQSAIFNLESGYTQGIVGFGVGAVGDASFKIGDNNHAGNQMIPINDQGNAYDHWARGGASVKARISNTNARYGTQVLDLPVLASNTGRMVPEYFEGVLAKSREIEDLEVVVGKFTKNQMSEQISTDENKLNSAIVWGAKYKFNDQINGSYYGIDSKNALERHYVNANFKQPLANNASLTYDFSGYRTEWDKGASASSSTLDANSDDRSNNIWAISGSYNTGAHNVMLAYQQSTGNTGYAYGENADGFQSIYLPNSYLSDFNGRDEKSVQVQYSVDLGQYVTPGLSWTSAYVYGWDIDTATDSNAKESEIFNQVKYTVQSGFAKDASLRVRYSHYRNDDAYANDYYMPDTNEWRLFLDIPVKLF